MQGFCFVLLSSLAVTQAFLPAFPLSTGQRPRVASRAQSISQRGGGVAVRSAQGRSVVRMAEGDGKGDGEKDGEEKDEGGFMGLFEKKEGERGGMSKFEYWGNYAFDLVTVTLGAGVFTCLFLNVLGRVPCI